jgi:hypothetical protein
VGFGLAAGAHVAVFSRVSPRNTMALEVNGYLVRDTDLFQHPFWQLGFGWLFGPAAPAGGGTRRDPAANRAAHGF